jgi:hypothetical protein
MTKEETAILAINEKISKLSEIINHTQFENWKRTTSTTLSNIYANDGIRISKFESIMSKVRVISGNGERTPEAKIEAIEYLSSLISDIEKFGLPHLISKHDALSINVHQHNEQNQSTQVSINFEYIVEILKGELRTSEIEELKEIIESEMEQKEKKKSFTDKIKSFGTDVSSNILASIFTNAQVYQKFGEFL